MLLTESHLESIIKQLFSSLEITFKSFMNKNHNFGQKMITWGTIFWAKTIKLTCFWVRTGWFWVQGTTPNPKTDHFCSKNDHFRAHLSFFRVNSDQFSNKMIYLNENRQFFLKKYQSWSLQVLFIARMMGVLHHVIIDLIKMPPGGVECVWIWYWKSMSDFFVLYSSSPWDHWWLISMTHSIDLIIFRVVTVT